MLSLLASLLLTTVGETMAAPFIPKMNEPKSYKDALFGAEETRQNIESVDCGGFDKDSNATVNGTTMTGGNVPIPDISPDLPGRDNSDPLGDPKTGLGTRGDFQYPGSAWGYLSACNMYWGRMHDPDLEKLGKDINLKIEDENDPNSAISAEVVDGSGDFDVNPKGWCIWYDKATPSWCKKLYEWFQILSASAPRPAINPDCPNPPSKKYCFDDPYTKECNGEECHTAANPNPGQCGSRLMPDFGSKISECHRETDADGNEFVVIDVGGYEYGTKSSFYRHYAGGFKVPGITVTEYKNRDGTNNIKEWKVRAECYEYYMESDPKYCVTAWEDEQCEFVISLPDEQNPDTPEWIPGDGHKQKKGYVPEAGLVQDPPRDPRTVPEPWVADTETNLSMIDMKRLRELQKDFEDPTDITGVIGALLSAKQRATKTTPDHARTDMFDDTAERKMSNFWEDQQKELLKMVTEPATRLVLPARAFVGLQKNDPFFQYVRNIVSRSNGIVEITLRAGPEDIGNALLSLERNLIMPIREVRIPLIVPLASEEELNTRIFEWKQWKMREDKDASKPPGRPSYAGMADPLITKLEQYRDAVEKERRMRGALANYLLKLFDVQRQIREYIAEWYTSDTAALKLSKLQSEDRRRLKWIWRRLQRAMLQTDECQLQWCSNQRYSAPVYSLLDRWWGDRQPGELRNADYLPRDLKDLRYEQPKDRVFDFSKMGFATGGLLVPVLWPVQVKLKLPLPPTVGLPPDPDEFPDLAPFPDETVFDSFPVPTVTLPPQTPLPPSPAADLSEAMQILREYRKIVDGTDIARQEQEETDAMTGTPPPDDNGPWNDRRNMRGSYCSFPPSIMIPPDPEDRHGNPAKIIHVESDLRERLARLFSRWMPERMEDVGGRAVRLSDEFTSPDDMDCHEDVVCNSLAPEETLTATWQWFMKVTTDEFTTLADAMRTLTCPFCEPPDETKNPYLDTPVELIKRTFQRLPLPIEIPLLPNPTLPLP